MCQTPVPCCCCEPRVIAWAEHLLAVTLVCLRAQAGMCANISICYFSSNFQWEWISIEWITWEWISITGNDWSTKNNQDLQNRLNNLIFSQMKSWKTKMSFLKTKVPWRSRKYAHSELLSFQNLKHHSFWMLFSVHWDLSNLFCFCHNLHSLNFSYPTSQRPKYLV